MSEYDKNHPRDFHVVKDERSDDKKVDPEKEHHPDLREETAAEYTPNPGLVGGRQQVDLSSDKTREVEDTENEDEAVAGKGVGTLALALSIVSLFFLPIIFAAAGLVLGFVSLNRHAKGLGYTAIAISAFSIIMSVFFAPFVS
ncbi:DUF4190 domain-containing protein [Bacillus shivajii]|uniref:DUF4190 domain-containing protein n=1 Tax=Bacillus shivajii TaxID=1983719 RepID=UPI001CF9F6EE|nr:DUF4190 domain-containing protein [Bacillus shivajii]UCZ54534.1 DUF4190 domain-containing protein [Bacillus shivajii]